MSILKSLYSFQFSPGATELLGHSKADGWTQLQSFYNPVVLFSFQFVSFSVILYFTKSSHFNWQFIKKYFTKIVLIEHYWNKRQSATYRYYRNTYYFTFYRRKVSTMLTLSLINAWALALSIMVFFLKDFLHATWVWVFEYANDARLEGIFTIFMLSSLQ